MKLKNKKTGEIIDDGYVRETHDFQFDGQKYVLAVFKGNGHRPPERVSGAYNSLAELNEEWEGAPEEPKEHWAIDQFGEPINVTGLSRLQLEKLRQCGNDFETEEESELAVRKLKAWKRLKDKGFRFDGYDVAHNSNGDLCGQLFYNAGDYCIEDVEKDLDLLFCTEDNS